ncbi:MAG: DnaJ domain-containing protein [Pseudomonadota bacterium]
MSLEDDIDENFADQYCAVKGCPHIGKYPAPRGRGAVLRDLRESHDCKRDYLYFCITHIRLYNERWNYYEGMDASMIESDRALDGRWQRASFGREEQLSKMAKRVYQRDVFASHAQAHSNQGDRGSKDRDEGAEERVWDFSKDERESLRVLGLKAPMTRSYLRAHYKKLVKKLHPDINPDNPKALEKIKKINHAYGLLRKAFLK